MNSDAWCSDPVKSAYLFVVLTTARTSQVFLLQLGVRWVIIPPTICCFYMSSCLMYSLIYYIAPLSCYDSNNNNDKTPLPRYISRMDFIELSEHHSTTGGLNWTERKPTMMKYKNSFCVTPRDTFVTLKYPMSSISLSPKKLTDLQFWTFVNICRSTHEHINKAWWNK